MAKSLTDHVVIKNSKLAAQWAGKKVPISSIFEAYFDGDVDIPGDIYAFLADRHHFTKHSFTLEHYKYFITKFVPETVSHSKKYDEELVRWHYDRGNDFFAAFLGPRMVYTSGYFLDKNQTLEEGQDQKLDLVCRKLELKPGERFLDIGCGWGTLAMHAAKHYGVDATGITISKNQAEYGNQKIREAGLEGKARILCLDYRDIPRGKWDKISNLEMVEHVGVKNLEPFYDLVRDLLADDGRFLMQWTGLRRSSSQEDLVWGLFMAKYIFAGADASLPVAPMIGYLEKTKWEVHSIENLSPHYRWTIKKWHDNWIENREAVVKSYGERWYRIWHVFLAWAVTVADQGTAACFQCVFNKNLNGFDRDQYIGSRYELGERSELPNRSEKSGKKPTQPVIEAEE